MHKFVQIVDFLLQTVTICAQICNKRLKCTICYKLWIFGCVWVKLLTVLTTLQFTMPAMKWLLCSSVVLALSCHLNLLVEGKLGHLKKRPGDGTSISMDKSRIREMVS